MQWVDVYKMIKLDSANELILIYTKKNTYDDSFYGHLYGMNKLTMMCGGCPPIDVELW